MNNEKWWKDMFNSCGWKVKKFQYNELNNNFDSKQDFVKNAAKEAMVEGVTGNKDFVSMLQKGNEHAVSDKIRACMKSNGFDPDMRNSCKDEAYDNFMNANEIPRFEEPMIFGAASDNFGIKKNEAQQSVTDIVQDMKDGKLTEKQFNDKLDKAINLPPIKQ